MDVSMLWIDDDHAELHIDGRTLSGSPQDVGAVMAAIQTLQDAILAHERQISSIANAVDRVRDELP